MQNVVRFEHDGPPSVAQGVAPSMPDLVRYWWVVRQRWLVVGSVATVVVALALIYVLTTRPLYTASSTILIDARKNQLLQSQQVVGDMQVDASGIESQIELIKSESVALAVIRDLKLLDDPIFSDHSSLLGTLLSAFRTADGALSDFERERRVVYAYLSALKVKRIGATYTINIEFTSHSPERSAEIVNSIAESYIANEISARYQTTRRASKWLQDRSTELREQANLAEARVREFRAQEGIIDTGRGLLSEQQLAELNAQLISARVSTAEAKAKLDRIINVASGDIPDATVTDALRNEVIIRLRAQYLDMAARYSEWSSRYGASHAAAINLQTQLQEIRRSISDELRRISETYKSDYEIARAREESLQESLFSLVAQSGTIAQAQVKLRDLESSAQTARNLHDNFLQRYLEAAQQQTFPLSEARVITAATPPIFKSAPRTTIIIGASSIVGLMLGTAAALFLERLDSPFRTAQDVETYTGARCLGILPTISEAGKSSSSFQTQKGDRLVSWYASATRQVLDAPFSRFAETIRSVKVEADINRHKAKARIIGVVSAVPKEGKTTIAANLAALIGHTGKKVLLIDADLHSASLTRSLAPTAEAGLVEVLTGAVLSSEVLFTDPETGLHLLPSVVKGYVPHTPELISSPAMEKLLEAMREHYEYVVVDLPPIMPVVDVRAAAHLIEGFLCVTEWGTTSRDALIEAFGCVDVLRGRLIGVLLNMAPAAALRRIESYKGRQYRSYHQDYGAVA